MPQSLRPDATATTGLHPRDAGQLSTLVRILLDLVRMYRGGDPALLGADNADDAERRRLACHSRQRHAATAKALHEELLVLVGASRWR